jgi:hypothetical protein
MALFISGVGVGMFLYCIAEGAGVLLNSWLHNRHR